MGKLKRLKQSIKKHHMISRVSRVKDYLFGIFKLVMGILIGSFIPIIYGLYSITVAISKEVYFVGNKKNKSREINQVKYYLIIATLILVSNLIFVIYSSTFFFIPNRYDIGFVPSLLLATFAFVELGFSIKAMFKKQESLLDRAHVYIGLTSTFVAIVFTQMALLSITETDKDLSFSNGLAGCIFGGISVLISLYMYYKGFKILKNRT